MLLFDYCPDGSGAALDAESLILSEPARAIAVFVTGIPILQPCDIRLVSGEYPVCPFAHVGWRKEATC